MLKEGHEGGLNIELSQDEKAERRLSSRRAVRPMPDRFGLNHKDATCSVSLGPHEGLSQAGPDAPITRTRKE